MLRFGWLPIEGVEITNWAARLPQNTFGWRWLLVEEFWTPPSPDTQSEIWQSSWCKMEKSYDFYPTKKEQKFSKNGQNFCKRRRKYIKIREHFEWNLFSFVCSFLWILFNENFVGNPISPIWLVLWWISIFDTIYHLYWGHKGNKNQQSS